MNKQTFIYKKNPTSAAKAITRKLRKSTVPTSEPNLDQQTSKHDATASINEGDDTIATHGQNSHNSPRM